MVLRIKAASSLTNRQIARPIWVFLTAIAVVACAMAAKGWQSVSFMLGAILLLIGGLLFIEVSRAVAFLRNRSIVIGQAAKEAEKHYIDVLRRVVRVVEGRSNYALGRSERIGRLTEQVASRLSLPRSQCDLLGLAGELHDIGMLAVPEAILGRNSRLGESDFRAVQQHCEAGYEMLKPLESLADILPAIRYHHERMNGTGYPASLSGEEIPLAARILAVADVYDAMTHDRPDRAAMSSATAVDELRRCSPDGYDAACVEALAEVLHLEASGGEVRRPAVANVG